MSDNQFPCRQEMSIIFLLSGRVENTETEYNRFRPQHSKYNTIAFGEFSLLLNDFRSEEMTVTMDAVYQLRSQLFKIICDRIK